MLPANIIVTFFRVAVYNLFVKLLNDVYKSVALFEVFFLRIVCSVNVAFGLHQHTENYNIQEVRKMGKAEVDL